MTKCQHKFIVTSWKISDHSHRANEIMCQKCLTCIEGEEMIHLRGGKSQAYHVVADHIKFMDSIESTTIL